MFLTILKVISITIILFTTNIIDVRRDLDVIVPGCLEYENNICKEFVA